MAKDLNELAEQKQRLLKNWAIATAVICGIFFIIAIREFVVDEGRAKSEDLKQFGLWMIPTFIFWIISLRLNYLKSNIYIRDTNKKK